MVQLPARGRYGVDGCLVVRGGHLDTSSLPRSQCCSSMARGRHQEPKVLDSSMDCRHLDHGSADGFNQKKGKRIQKVELCLISGIDARINFHFLIEPILFDCIQIIIIEKGPDVSDLRIYYGCH